MFQIIIAPLALVPIFIWQNIDICFLGILVLLMNLYIAWYHIDNADEYGQNDSDDSEDDD